MDEEKIPICNNSALQAGSFTYQLLHSFLTSGFDFSTAIVQPSAVFEVSAYKMELTCPLIAQCLLMLAKASLVSGLMCFK